MAKRKSPESATAPTESFEASLTELQSIVTDLEDGSLGLEASLARFERGVGLLRTCSVLLESVEQKIETLTRFEEPAMTAGDASSATAASQPNEPDLDDAKNSTKPSLF